MKVIDLLNKIANGEEVPKKIKYDEKIYYLDDGNYRAYNKYGYQMELMLYNPFHILNDEVEVIEEDKKIEKLEHMNSRSYLENRDEYLSTRDIALDIETLRNWINKIIDYLEENK